jgi:hypothetical protein
MQVATMPKGATMVGGQRIVQAAPGKPLPQGATIVKLVNAQGQPGNQKKKYKIKLITRVVIKTARFCGSASR